MSNSDVSKNTEQQKKILLSTLKFTGFLFIGAGAYALLYPSTIENFLDLDASFTKIFAAALIFTGISDLVIMQYLGKKL